MTEKNDLKINYISDDKDQFYVEKKIELHKFIGKEIFVFGCITFATYISIFISSQKFATAATEENLAKSISVILQFFSLGNLIDTSIGLLTVIGILCFINQLATHSEINIQPILNRLITAITDFYYLMFSTILGCLFGLLHFVHKYPSIKGAQECYELAITNIPIIGIFGTATAIIFQYFINKNKVL